MSLKKKSKKMRQYESGYWPIKPTRENCVYFLLMDVDNVTTQLEAFFHFFLFFFHVKFVSYSAELILAALNSKDY